MSNMPDEVREAFKILERYEYKEANLRRWDNFGYELEDYNNYEFRLKRERPLTVEEALKLEMVYVPYLHISLTKGIIPEHFDIIYNIETFAKSDLAYRTPEGAIAHAKMWLGMEVGE